LLTYPEENLSLCSFGYKYKAYWSVRVICSQLGLITSMLDRRVEYLEETEISQYVTEDDVLLGLLQAITTLQIDD